MERERESIIDYHTNLLVCWSLLNCCENPRGFDNIVWPKITPRNLCWVPERISSHGSYSLVDITLDVPAINNKCRHKDKDEMSRPIPFTYNFNLFPINFQSRVIQGLDCSLENSMSRVVLKHVCLQKMNSKLLPNYHI